MSGTPGRLNTSQWEQQTASPAAPGAAPAAGSKGKAAFFEQAAKEAGPKDVQKKKVWKNTGNSGGYANQGKYAGKTQIGDGPPAAKVSKSRTVDFKRDRQLTISLLG